LFSPLHGCRSSLPEKLSLIITRVNMGVTFLSRTILEPLWQFPPQFVGFDWKQLK
jgi:hypothetical protein